MTDEPRALVPTNALALFPVLSLVEAKRRYDEMVQFVSSIMRPDLDYGTIPGTNKPTLYKPGAEKLTRFFGLSVSFHLVDKVEDWEAGLFFYRYVCDLHREGVLIANGEGSANSKEDRYRWRWVGEANIPAGMDKSMLESRSTTLVEFTFAIEKAETTGKYGKSAAYWERFQKAIDDGTAKRGSRKAHSGQVYATWEIGGETFRIPNPDPFTLVNTLQKMAQKRAFVAATLVACNASEFFTQDLEDLGFDTEESDAGSDATDVQEGHFVPVPSDSQVPDSELKEKYDSEAAKREALDRAAGRDPAKQPPVGMGPQRFTDGDRVQAIKKALVDAGLVEKTIVSQHLVHLLNLSPFEETIEPAQFVMWVKIYESLKAESPNPEKADKKALAAAATGLYNAGR